MQSWHRPRVDCTRMPRFPFSQMPCMLSMERTMKVDILYIEGCPNHTPASERVRAVLRDAGISAEVNEIEIADEAAAKKFGFPGRQRFASTEWTWSRRCVARRREASLAGIIRISFRQRR